MLGSGPFGELIAIEYLQVVAGSFILIGFGFAVLNMLNGRLHREGSKQVGVAMMALGSLAAVIYVAGLVCVRMGWLEAGFRPDRLAENLVGALGFIALGAMITALPRLLNRVGAARRD